MGFPLDWFTGVPTDKKEDIKLILENSTVIRQQLAKIIDGQLQSLSQSEISETAYDNPNWAEKQAHRNGRRQALSEILRLISFKA